ncbi:Diphosphomevalonate decarboxylase [Boletus edulis BED1]|uniref:Diphosphomevalonate decarboxylase n=1 Tax=Boletus edulis BED1 TaxID=1328754 RepID=A0AAD4GI31_BOLED|nr:Diphosphomevalonate decarboxylase [Boletus edulis BED1]
MSKVFQATASAPVNIACIKYWGKRDTKLILPTNSSLSVTLSQDHLRSTTTSRADPSFAEDTLWLNGKLDEIKPGGRLATCISEMKRLRKELEDADPNAEKFSHWRVHICSHNNFPTAAGLASSASGFAALVYSLAKLYQLPASPKELSLIARQGSGSACRSLLGGFVAWREGAAADGSDSFAEQIASEADWPAMHALVCVVSDDKKDTSSTAGMQRTVETSALFSQRLTVVPERMRAITNAIQNRDFDTFAAITMKDSNQFHAVALDTDPPIFYMNDVSRAIITVVTEYNRVALEKCGQRKAAYTFDAGPNAVIYAPRENMKEIIELIVSYFPQESFNDPFQLFGSAPVQGRLMDGFNEGVSKRFAIGAVKTLIHTCVGDGPRVRGDAESLLGHDGLPKSLA